MKYLYYPVDYPDYLMQYPCYPVGSTGVQLDVAMTHGEGTHIEYEADWTLPSLAQNGFRWVVAMTSLRMRTLTLFLAASTPGGQLKMSPK
mmetsp:Transcript_66992/g.118959  ORF Transcript_66992/g.118959 Transcript_66992/m.118959 type:complete len:90 (-) Transcript_66992:24-293(-)